MSLASTFVVCLMIWAPARLVPLAGAAAVSSAIPRQDSHSDSPADNPSQPAPPKNEPTPAPAAAPDQNSKTEQPAPEPAQPDKSGAGAQPQAPAPPPVPAPDQPAQSTAPVAVPGENPKTKASQRTKTAQRSSTKRNTAKSVPPSTKPDANAPSKVVVKNGSAAEPTVQLSPSLSQQQASTQRQGTNQLLADTDENLKKLSGRQLASNQQDMVQQIRIYVEQAKAASDAGDLDRAHNLALKASLLAQELAKP